MDKIPVTYDYDGKEYRGFLEKVSGSGGTANFHLYVDNYYHGQLVYTSRGFQFSDQKGNHPELAAYFEFVIISYYS